MALQLVLNLEGTLLATASDKGTLVRIFDTVTGAKVREFRRGTTAANIYSIAFSRNSNYIIVGSDKGTVHVYALYDPSKGPANPTVAGAMAAGNTANASGGNSNVVNNGNGGAGTTAAEEPLSTTPGFDDDDGVDGVKNKHSRLSFMKDVLPGYFSSEWSFASFTVEIPSKKFYTAFGSDETTILVVCEDGTYYKYLLRPDQARIVQVGDASFK
jgi:WD40 repeat protein